MSWHQAMNRALYRSQVQGTKVYVRGYRTSLGRWRYGVYVTPKPRLVGRVWDA